MTDDASLFELRHASTDRPTIVTVGPRRVIAVDGIGDPSGSDFRLASGVLRRVSADLSARLARRQVGNQRRPVLECAWWRHPEPAPVEIPAVFKDRGAWHWQQMIEIPWQATEDEVADAIADAMRDAGRDHPLVRAIGITEGRAAQMLHLGATTPLAATLRKLYAAVAEAGLRPHGPIHEVRLADEADVPVERARAILRVPIGSD